MEIWKGLIYQNKDYSEWFEVSNKGKIRNSKNKKIYKQCINPNGYYQVNLSYNAIKKTIRTHKAVAETFIENKNNFSDVNHIDGNKLNNVSSNLEWCTRRYNNIHALKKGLRVSAKGEKQANAKLNYDIVKYIREIYKPRSKEYGCRALAMEYNVCHKTIEQIINDKTWI